MKRTARIAAWVLLFSIAFVTLGPAQDRPQTSLAHNLEHALAFILLGFAFSFGYAKRRAMVAIAAGPAIGLLELLQLWTPGRHARLEDFVVNLATFGAAFVALILAERILNRTAKTETSSKN